MTSHAMLPSSPISPSLPSSPFSRHSLAAYVFLIFYASCYPFTGWQFEKFSAFFDQLNQWPHYWAKFDAIINVIGYVPLGALIVLSLYPFINRTWSFVIATLSGIVLSFLMEGTQFFIPSRVMSLLDLLTNATGCFIGAALAAICRPTILEKGRLQLLGKQWIEHDTSRIVLIISLWPLAQIFPQAFLFGLGQILPAISLWSEEYLDITINLSALLRIGMELNAEEYLLSETLITACGATGAVLMCLSILSHRAPKFTLSSTLLIAGMCTKSLAYALLLQPDNAFSWLTPGANGGIIISIMMLYGFSFTPHHVQRRLALVCLMISFILVNLIPSNPYFLVTFESMMQGKMLNFYGAAQFLSLAWPFIAFWYLLKLNGKNKSI